jgi:multidrug efflux pump subunit AcrA (membrane-fusion protein)/YHS domain-containing protein
MHPAYKSDKPGIAPDCGMQLEPVYAEGGSAGEPEKGEGPASLAPGSVQVSPEKQQIIGVQVGQVEKAPGILTLRTLGRVTLDETRVFRVVAAVEGWVTNAGPIITGDMVGKDEVLATFYNRDLLTAQGTYLYALNTMDRLKDIENEEQLKITKAEIRASEEGLEFLGMGETQLREVARTRQIATGIELRSPVAGLVVARNAFTGLRFDRGAELYRVADISHVWILADIFENEARHFRPGTNARVMIPNLGRVFQAKVSAALPQFDPNSRTLKMRLEMDNPDYTLRPDMFVDVELPVRLPPAITVPAGAVLDSGLRKTVFVVRGQGYFEPRRVETGTRYGDRVEITKGLEPGERIVVSGNFLIDSESRMELAAAGLYGELNKDPVCGMGVAEGKAKAAGRTSVYRGETYFFCSDHCKQDFDKDPEHYIRQGSAGHS